MIPVLANDQPVPLGWRSSLMLALLSIAGVGMFAWPLIVPSAGTTTNDAPFIFIALLPMLMLLVLAQVSEAGIDAKALAILGVLSAVNAALRPLGAGTNGIETVFFLLVLAGRVFGPGFGFVLGCTSIFASSLLTAGVGPWMPFQMLASAWIGLGAGLLPHKLFGRPLRGATEIVLLVVYGVAAAYLFGAIMNLWFWPFMTGPTGGADLAYIPGGPLLTNLKRFLGYTLVTSAAVWDTGRAITNAVLLALLGQPVLAILRRTVRRAVFSPEVRFLPPMQPVAPTPQRRRAEHLPVGL